MQSVTGPGRVVADRYRLLDLIGHGAMGTVWRARDLVLTRDVAVKEVRVPALMTEQDRKILHERSLREAKVAARLNHPGVVCVHDVTEAEGSPWIVMELVAGRSLAQVIATDGPVEPPQAAELGMMLLAALATAHAAGIVHRDVKPSNVLLADDGRAVLTDFGIATVDGDPSLTQAGIVLGTPGFCAPERIRGGPATAASDLWSLGATLYAAVEGHGPFDGQGSALAVLASIVHAEPPQAPSAGTLGPVISSLMNRDPSRRPDAASAATLLATAVSRPAPAPRSTVAAGRHSASHEAVGRGFALGPTASWQPAPGQPAPGQWATGQPAPGQWAPGQREGTRAGSPGRHRRAARLGGTS